MIVVGVDPSISSTGVALLGDRQDFYRVRTKPAGEDVAARLGRMRESVLGVLRCVSGFEVVLAVVEAPAFGKSNGMTHMLAGHWWLMAHALEKLAPVATVAPGTLKKFATGSGRAEKDAVLLAASKVFGDEVPNNDVADAAVLAAMGAVHMGLSYGRGHRFASSGEASVRTVHWPSVEGGL